MIRGIQVSIREEEDHHQDLIQEEEEIIREKDITDIVREDLEIGKIERRIRREREADHTGLVQAAYMEVVDQEAKKDENNFNN